MNTISSFFEYWRFSKMSGFLPAVLKADLPGHRSGGQWAGLPHSNAPFAGGRGFLHSNAPFTVLFTCFPRRLWVQVVACWGLSAIGKPWVEITQHLYRPRSTGRNYFLTKCKLKLSYLICPFLTLKAENLIYFNSSISHFITEGMHTRCTLKI